MNLKTPKLNYWGFTYEELKDAVSDLIKSKENMDTPPRIINEFEDHYEIKSGRVYAIVPKRIFDYFINEIRKP
jgi:hypothetical protein